MKLTQKSRGKTKYFVNVDGEIMSRNCTKCRKVKPLTDFLKKKDGFAGRFAHCYECDKVLKYKWRENNREKETDRVKKWYENPENREKKRRYTAEWRKRSQHGLGI